MPLSLQEIFDRYQSMLEEAVARYREPWFARDSLPDRHEAGKFDDRLTPAILDRFRDYHIGGIGLEVLDIGVSVEEFYRNSPFSKLPELSPEDRAQYERTVREYASFFLNSLLRAVPRELPAWLSCAQDTVDVGGLRATVEIGRHLYLASTFSLRMASRPINLRRALSTIDPVPEIRSVIELGGGHGKTLSDFLKLHAVNTAYYVDLPLNMALTARYFELMRPGSVNLVWSEEDEVLEKRVNIVAPWLLHKIAEPIDLLVNFLSMHHMPSVSQKYYFDALIDPRVRYVYHENRLHPRDGYEGALVDSALRTAFRRLTSEVVGRPRRFSTSGVELPSPDDHAIHGELLANPRFVVT